MEQFQRDGRVILEDDTGVTGYWHRATAGNPPYGRALAHMGLDMSSIPAVCTSAQLLSGRYVLSTRRFRFLHPSLPYPPRILLQRNLHRANTSRLARQVV